MEGERDRGEDGDSPEGSADSFDSYRKELRERYPDSGNARQGNARPDTTGEISGQENAAPTKETPDEAAEERGRLEHGTSPPDAQGLPAPGANTRFDEQNESGVRSAEDSESRAEPRIQSELERLREDFMEQPHEGSQTSKPEEREASTETGENARPELEQLRREIREKQEESDAKTELAPHSVGTSTASEIGKVDEEKAVFSDSEIRDSGDKIDSHQRESEKAVRSDKSAREADSVHEETTAMRVGAGSNRAPEFVKELADLEKSNATSTENGSSGRKESETRTTPEISRTEFSQQEKMGRGDAISVNARLHQSHPMVITFDIPKKDIEEKTGVKIEEGKLYRIKGNVGGKYDFEMYRTVDSYVRHSVPVEHHHQIQGGKTYDIRVTSVEEVPLTKAQSQLVSEWRERGVPWNRIAYRINHMQPETAERQIPLAQDSGPSEKKLHQLEKAECVDNIAATFLAVSRFQGKDKANHEDRFYFRIDNSEYKQKTGMAIEEGATYKIKGEIEGVGQFEKKLRSVAAGQDMPIYVPRELNSKIELGKQYKITIDSIERIPSVRDSWEKLERPSNEWTWKEIASWIDTEGRINTESGYYADIAQKDKRVIQEICGFYDDHGLHPMMILNKSVGGWHAQLHRVDDVATVIKNIEPYIRTENKKEQIQQFKESLSAPRKKLHGGIRKARKVLGVE